MKMILKNICLKIGSGATPRGGKEAYQGGKFALIRSQNVIDFMFSNEGLVYINDEQANKLDNVALVKGDVLLNITGDSVARACIVPEKILPARVNQHVAIIRGNNRIILQEYLLYFFQMSKDRLLQLASVGATRNALTKGMIEDLELELPSLEVQKKIVNVLDSICKKIDTNKEINNNLEQQAQAIYDMKYGCYNVVSASTVSSMLPSNWEYWSLEELCKHIKPGTNYQPERTENGIPFLNIKCINNGYIDMSEAKYISIEDYKKVHKMWKPEIGDILISRIGTLGLVAAIRECDIPLVVHYNFINIKADLLPFEFMYFMFKSKGFQSAYHLIKKQSVQEYVTIDDVAALKIPLPNKDELAKIDFTLYKSLYHKIEENQHEITKLSCLRDLLLPKLMSGELDVSELEF